MYVNLLPLLRELLQRKFYSENIEEEGVNTEKSKSQ